MPRRRSPHREEPSRRAAGRCVSRRTPWPRSRDLLRRRGRPLLFPPRPMMPGGAPGGVPAARPIVAPRPSVAPSAITAPTSNAAPTARQSGGVVAPSPAPAPPAAASASVAAPRPVSSGPAPTGARTPINPFLANDPHAKAKRLARALVSDLVTYFPQKRQDGLRDGTLKQLFKEEIKRSYEE